MPKRSKTVYNKDGIVIKIAEMTTATGKYQEHGLYAYYVPHKGKKHEILKARVMGDKHGGIGYILVVNNINWVTGEQLPGMRPVGSIIRSDDELIRTTGIVTREILDRLHAEVLACRMKC